MLSTGQHTLTTQPDSDDSFKHCILIKLTDSSAKAIEEYIKNKDNTNKKPSIMFHKDKGEIFFPVESNSKQSSHNTSQNSNDPSMFQYKKFQFSLSSVKESNKDTSASFECISYTNSKLKTMGSIEQKLTVHAINDEVFQATKERVASVVEAEKNNSTIEIKHSGAIVNRSGTAVSNMNGQNMNRNKPNNIMSSTTVRPNPSPVNTSLDSSKPKSLVTDKSLRERVIHLLAIKPYKKPEIFLKLNKENPLADKEKEALEATLQSVATMNPKNNQFDLLNEVMLNEVKEDWPAYNQNDKQVVKRNLAKLKQNSSFGNTSLNTSLNTSSSSNRPSSSLSSSFTNPAVSKQSSAFVSIPTANIKEESLVKKTSPIKNENSIRAPFQNGTTNSTPINSTNNHSFKTKFPTLSPSTDNLNDSHDLSLNNNKKVLDYDQLSNANKRLKPNGMHLKQEPLPATEHNEFSDKYKSIQTNQQFKEYKDQFDQNYKEYNDLYNYLRPTAKQFDTYRQEMEVLTDQNSKEYLEKKKKVVEDYFAKKKDLEYVRKRERYEYLDRKLNYLNELFEKYASSLSSSMSMTH